MSDSERELALFLWLVLTAVTLITTAFCVWFSIDPVNLPEHFS